MLTLVLLALTLLVYLPALYANPIWDDAQIFQMTPEKWILRGSDKKGRPRFPWDQPRWITQATFGLTFAACYRFRKDWQPTMIVAVLHLGNVLLHWLNCLIVYQVASLMVGDRAIVAALFFAVHPLAASAVSPIVSRSSLLSSTFIYLAVWLVLLGHPFLALFMAAGAFSSKEDAITAFGLVIALTALLDWNSALIMLGASILVFQRVYPRIRTMVQKLLKFNGDIRMEAAGLPVSLEQPHYSITAIVENLRRWPLWMLGFELNPDPDPKPRSIAAASVCIFLVTLLICSTWNTVGTLILLITLISPWTATWFFRLPDPVSELRAYSTLLPMVLILSYVPLGMVVPLIVWFAAISGYRAWLQQNEMALWRHAWNEGSRKLRVAINVAAAYQKFGKVEESFNWHKKALDIAPKNGLVLINVALWFEGRARLERQEVMNGYMGVGKFEAKLFEAKTQSANQYLAQAVALAREAMVTAGGDPWVQHYSKAIEAHAAGLGMNVEVVKPEEQKELVAT